MAQNTSSAVMQQRAGPPDSLDFFPTPPWGTRALCEHVLPEMPGTAAPLSDLAAWNPACGRGDMARPLLEYFGGVASSDIYDYGIGAICHDFRAGLPPGFGADWIITNPPFNQAAVFARRGLGLARAGVALLVRLAFLEGIARYKQLFQDSPPLLIAQFTERIPMIKGRLDPGASSATAYAWVVWTARENSRTRFIWIPPCRAVLERHGDYDGYDVTPGSRPGQPSGDLFP